MLPRTCSLLGYTVYTPVDRNALIPLLRFAAGSLCNLFIQFAAVDKISTGVARRAVRLRLQSIFL